MLFENELICERNAPYEGVAFSLSPVTVLERRIRLTKPTVYSLPSLLLGDTEDDNH